MTIPLTFLSASLPLTKTIEKLSDGTIHKSPYPLIVNFTSETVEVKNIQEFHAALLHRATHKRKPCLLKGKITRELVAESRKGTTVTNDKTQWVCLDIDDARFSSPDEVMRALARPEDFLDVPSDAPNRWRKTSGLCRDTVTDARAAFVVRDGDYVSARWPGDVHTFAKIFFKKPGTF